MAARRGRSNRRPKSQGKEILDYRHKDVKRKNNPEEGLATYLPEEHETKRYEYDPHLDPQLVWTGKSEHTSFNVPVVPLHIHERITPKSIVDALKKSRDRQAKLFDEGEYPIDKRVEFYRHDVDWANRLVLGDSLLVMNSLLTKELMGGKVQMVFFDPPYGISYSSNFQPTVADHDVEEGRDDSLTREPEQIKAYRDTWELGIHSYLTYIRDRLLLCKELLSGTGSVFVQISDENVHRVRALLDEVFGAENFVSLIPFRKKLMPLGAKTLENMCDYLLWYAKDKEAIKYHQLYTRSEPKASSRWTGVELANGTRRKLTREEADDLDALPKGSKVFRLVSQTAPSFAQSSVYEFVYKGRKFVPKPGQSWVTTKERMEELAKKKRLETEGDSLSYVMYHDDFPYAKLTNPWMDTVGAFDKTYVVETNANVIARCILMTTEPGDLVFDPTCGSGATAYASEQWGRRWITCDTSRVALALARQRMLGAAFQYYRLSRPEEGLKSGLECETVPHITLRSLAQGEEPKLEKLYDRPLVDASVVRVSGPLTVEGIPPPTAELSDAAKQPEQQRVDDYIAALVAAVRSTGFIFSGGKKMRLDNVVQISSGGFIHAEGVALDGSATKVAISFGPRYGPVGTRQTEEVIRTATANGYDLLIIAGFGFDPGAQAFVERTPLKVKVQFAHVSPDMEIHDLLKKTQTSQLFTIFGEPDVSVIEKGGQYVVGLRGVDVYDPTNGEIAQTNGGDLPAWFLDEDYDGFSFNICQAFFPDGATRKNPWDRLENALRGTIDAEKMEVFRATTSMPFKKGAHNTIAVKVIDQRGNEAIKIIKLQAK